MPFIKSTLQIYLHRVELNIEKPVTTEPIYKGKILYAFSEKCCTNLHVSCKI